MNNLTPAQTVAAVKAAYPDAGPSRDSAPYCIGAAFCRFVFPSMGPARFVNITTLAMALYYHNPSLTQRDALAHAGAIINHNDGNRPAQAWEALERALGARA